MTANITFPGGELSDSRMLVLRMTCKLRRNETSYIALARGMFILMAQLECGPDEAFFANGYVSGGVPAKHT